MMREKKQPPTLFWAPARLGGDVLKSNVQGRGDKWKCNGQVIDVMQGKARSTRERQKKLTRF